MPLYEFHCSDCGRDSEVLVRSTHWQGTECPKCGSTRLSKNLSVFAAPAAADGGGEALPPCAGNPASCGRCAI